ncbi:MAG: metallophosphoesterase [Phormidesmis sp.]
MWKTVKKSLLITTGLVAVLGIWGLIEPKTLNLEEEAAQIPGLPADWQGRKIGQLSDFQVGPWWDNAGTAHRAVDRLVEEAPAAVLISGDFVYHAEPDPQPKIEEAVSIVLPLVEAGIPTYAVLGNHDYGMSGKEATPQTELASELAIALEDAGVVILENESTEMSLPDSEQTLSLVGVGSRWANQADVNKALQGVSSDQARITMMHNPDTYEQFPASSAPLAVAGHTHGGQLRVPGLPQTSWLQFVQKDEVYADGWAKGYGEPGNNLYVNPGIGMSIIPIRLFCPPEVTIFTLEGE